MLDVCSSGKEGEESTFEERSHDAGQQQGLNGSLSGGNPNGGPSALSVHSIPGAAANFIPPQRHLQPIQKLGNGEPQICPKIQRLFLSQASSSMSHHPPHDDAEKEVALLATDPWWAPAGGSRTQAC